MNVNRIFFCSNNNPKPDVKKKSICTFQVLKQKIFASAWKTTKNHSVKNLICHVLEGKLSSDLCFEENSAALLSLLILRVEWQRNWRQVWERNDYNVRKMQQAAPKPAQPSANRAPEEWVWKQKPVGTLALLVPSSRIKRVKSARSFTDFTVLVSDIKSVSKTSWIQKLWPVS